MLIMQSPMALHAFAAFCFFIGVSGSKGNISVLTTINTMKFEARDIAKDIAAFGGKMSNKSATAYWRYKRTGIELLYKFFSEQLSPIEDSAGIANKKDINAVRCFNSARADMDLQITALKTRSCDRSDLSPFRNLSSTITPIIEIGDRIIQQLDEVVLKCCSSNRMHFEACAVKSLSTPRQILEDFRRRGKDLKKSGRVFLANSGKFQCFGRRMRSIIKQEIPQICSIAKQCVKRAKGINK